MHRVPQLRTISLVLASAYAAFASTAWAAASDTQIADTQTAPATSAQAGATDQGASLPQTITQVQVTAARLREARIGLSPKVGTTVYTIDSKLVDSLGQGENTPFNEVLLHLPGVSQDSKASGSLHVRDDHADVQYRVNGVQLPEGISGFGQSIDTRLVDHIDFMTGALPAQFGLRTAGIVDIQTKEGSAPGGRIGVQVGSHDDFEPSAEFFGSKGAFNYYLSGSYLGNSLGIENPTPERNAIHDKTRQNKSFGNFSYYLDDQSRVGLMFGTYNGRYQIPNNPGQAPGYSLSGVSDAGAGTSTLASSNLDERQREVNRFLVLSYQKTIGDLDFQVSGFHQYSELHYSPDPVGDLVFNGVSSDTLRSNTANGVQLDMGYKLNPQHTLRAGAAYTRQTTHSNNTVAVFPTDASGAQAAEVPIPIVDNTAKTGTIGSLYVQDEWHVLEPLTLNYGVRFDKVSAFVHEQQWSPRVNLLYKLSSATALHAGYSRYFTPPPQELAAQSSIDLYANTSNAPEIPVSDPVKSERTNYYDVGISHQVNSKLTLTADAYYKHIRNMLDEGQFGQALIMTPFNYARGMAKGLELSAIYDEKDWGGYLNMAFQKAQGSDINSGQSLFGLDELAYIQSHAIYVDHDQTRTLSGGGHYRFGDSQLSADVLYGSGLRRTPDGGAPNSARLPSYVTVNTTLTHTWAHTPVGRLEGRVALLNLFDRSHLLRDGSGVGVGAPQFGPRRSVYVGLEASF